MRNYWLKIVAGALAIFAVGMALVVGFRKVTATLKSSDPIPIPLIGMVPFRVDSTRVGSVDRLELLRADPEHIAGIRVIVSLADSVRPDRLRSCRFELPDLTQVNEKTTFRCQSADSAGGGLEPFGAVVVSGGRDTFPLLVPARTASKWRETRIHFGHSGLQVDIPRDSVTERRDSLHELLSNRVDARSDSVDNLKELAGSLEDSSTNLDVTGRQRVQRSADSVRGAMRAMVERLKADEARMKVLDSASALTMAQLDSIAGKITSPHDSLIRSVTPQSDKVRNLAPKHPETPLPPAAPSAPAHRPR